MGPASANITPGSRRLGREREAKTDKPCVVLESGGNADPTDGVDRNSFLRAFCALANPSYCQPVSRYNGVQSGNLARDPYKMQKAMDTLAIGSVMAGGIKETSLGQASVKFTLEDMTEVRLLVITDPNT